MSSDKLSSFLSLAIAFAILGAWLLQWQNPTWNGGGPMSKRAKVSIGIGMVVLLIVAYLFIIAE